MAFAAVALGFSSATQDIVIDAYRIDSAGSELQAMMSSAYIAGYRVGMIAAGAGALYLAQLLGSTTAAYDYEAWRWTYVAMAAVMGVGMVTTLAIPEPGGRTAGRETSSARAVDAAVAGRVDESVDAGAGIEAGATVNAVRGAGTIGAANARERPDAEGTPDEAVAGSAADRPLGENLRFFAAFLIGVASFVLAYRAAGDPAFGDLAGTVRAVLVAASGNEAFAGLLAAALRRRELADRVARYRGRGRRPAGRTSPGMLGAVSRLGPVPAVLAFALVLLLPVMRWGGEISLEFVSTTLLVVAIPGIGVLYTISCALAGGRARGLVAAIGCTLGIVPHLIVAFLGLSGLMQLGATLFEVVRWAGVLYLAWMGVTMLRGGEQRRGAPGDPSAADGPAMPSRAFDAAVEPSSISFK